MELPSEKPSVSRSEQEPASSRSFDADALTRALRIAGAALVVASASTFMLQHWAVGNDLLRYAMLVAQSLLLAAAAYFVGLTMREGRSARTFLALVLGTIPISFTVLAGLLYSQFHLEALTTLPHYASWVAPDALSALLALAGTLLLLVPLAVVSFVALARKEAKALSWAFCAANLALLVPVRRPELAVLLAGAVVLGLLRLELTRFAGSAHLDTIEGKLARVMPFVPPMIMLGRAFHLYHVGPAFLGGVLLIAAAALWQVLNRSPKIGLRDLGACASSVLGIAGWALCWCELNAQMPSDACTVLLFGLPGAALLFVGSWRAVSCRAGLVNISTTVALLTALGASALDQGTAAAFCCIALGVSVGVWGAAVKARVRTMSGALVALWGIALQVWLAVHADNLLRWASLTAVGILLIVGSAYVERNRARLARLWELSSPRRVEEASL
jgi:hypothetical protein